MKHPYVALRPPAPRSRTASRPQTPADPHQSQAAPAPPTAASAAPFPGKGNANALRSSPQPRGELLLARHLRILRRNDLPLAVPFQPRIRPNQAPHRLFPILAGLRRPLTSIHHRQVRAEEPHLCTVELAFVLR